VSTNKREHFFLTNAIKKFMKPMENNDIWKGWLRWEQFGKSIGWLWRYALLLRVPFGVTSCGLPSTNHQLAPPNVFLRKPWRLFHTQPK
jgi:hypothetical protein